MTQPHYDVLGIGNAIVDVTASSDDAFLQAEGLDKGAMMLIDAARAESLYAKMGAATETSGGSAGNTVAGLASFGARAAYIGKVAADQLGGIFSHDIRAQGVTFTSKPLHDGEPTARSLILVTPDAQRTMNTYLGACTALSADDIDEDLVGGAAVTYVEGYLWDRPKAKEAVLKAMGLAHKHNRKVALSLSDSFCVDRHRDEFLMLVADHVDILFANENEICALYQNEDFDQAIAEVRDKVDIAALTRSEKGSAIVRGAERFDVAAHTASAIIDSTGAGDLYAAGFLHGYCQQQSPQYCAQLGGLAAAEVISHFGARPQCSLQELVAEAFSEVP